MQPETVYADNPPEVTNPNATNPPFPARDPAYPADAHGPRSTVPTPTVLAKKSVILLFGDRVLALGHTMIERYGLTGARAIAGGPAFPGTQYFMPSVGAKIEPPKKQTAYVNHHDTVVDILKAHNRPTDGSLVMLRPGTLVPFGMDNQPYHDINNGDVLEVVSNHPSQIGPFVTEGEAAHAQAAATALQAKPGVAAPPFPKILSDPDPAKKRADVTVKDATEEAKARADGFTVLAAKQPESFKKPAPAAVAQYPKLMRNPAARPIEAFPFTVKGPGGQFTQPDRLVENADEEATAKAEGFIVELPAPAPEPAE